MTSAGTLRGAKYIRLETCSTLAGTFALMAAKTSGQINAFFRWKTVRDTPDTIEMSLFLIKPSELKTTFTIPTEATADVSLRRLQKLRVALGAKVRWTFGTANGEVQADATGCITLPKLKMTAEPVTLMVTHAK